LQAKAKAGLPVMVVSFIIHSVAPWGTYLRADQLGHALTKLGCRVRIFGVDENAHSRERVELRDGLEYHIVPSGRGQRYFMSHQHPIVALYRAWKDYGVNDVVHMFQPCMVTYAPWRRELRKNPGGCWFDWDDLWTDGGLRGSHARGLFRDRWEYYWFNRIEHAAPRLATGVTTASKWLAEEATRRGARKTVLLHHGIWSKLPIDKRGARNKFGLSPSGIYLGFMGRSISAAEFSWCLDGLRATMDTNGVRLALCGPLDHHLATIPSDLKDRVDYVGVHSAADSFEFAAALDFALLPLEDNPFNRSRFPLKLSDYLSVRTRVIASGVGECVGLAREIRGMIGAGTTREEWVRTVADSVRQYEGGTLAGLDYDAVERLLSWESIGARVLEGYASASASFRLEKR
jgi:hypothetical protein